MKALDVQIGGNHYKTMAIQPMEFSLKLDLNAAKHTAIKYASRFESKGGIEDLRKAAHCLELLRDYWVESDRTDYRDFEHLAAAMAYCRENRLSAMQTDFIVLTVMAYDHNELACAIESCRDLIAAVECNNYHDIIMPNPVTGNWPASVDELDMSDPDNWRIGDTVKVVDNFGVNSLLGLGDILTIHGLTEDEDGHLAVSVSEAEKYCYAYRFQWHSRPSTDEIIKDGIVTQSPGDVFIQTEDGETARYSAAGYAASKEQ